jgi:hypothetical protein
MVSGGRLWEQAGKASGQWVLPVLYAVPFWFLGATPLCGVGLSAPIPQPPYGRLAGFPLQSLAQRGAIERGLRVVRERGLIGE